MSQKSLGLELALKKKWAENQTTWVRAHSISQHPKTLSAISSEYKLRILEILYNYMKNKTRFLCYVCGDTPLKMHSGPLGFLAFTLASSDCFSFYFALVLLSI